MSEAPHPLEPFLVSAREYVRRATKLELDGSEASLAFVDHYISDARKEPLRDEIFTMLAATLGAYFGQVCVDHYGGTWHVNPEAPPPSWQVEIEGVELSFSPVGMAAAALRHDTTEGYDDTLHTSMALSAPLAEALAAAAPVDESYYYSLTGRFETIGHAAELLVALRERDKPKPKGSGDSDGETS